MAIASVSPTEVQWKGLVLEKPPEWSRYSLYQVSMPLHRRGHVLNESRYKAYGCLDRNNGKTWNGIIIQLPRLLEIASYSTQRVFCNDTGRRKLVMLMTQTSSAMPIFTLMITKSNIVFPTISFFMYCYWNRNSILTGAVDLVFVLFLHYCCIYIDRLVQCKWLFI